MARYGKQHIIGRVIVLLLLIIVMAGGGIVWFDYLNVIDAKTVLAPLYRFIRREGRSQPQAAPDELLVLDAERLAVRLEALELRSLEMDRRDQDLQIREGTIEQMAQELEERQKALDDREKSFSDQVDQAETKQRNVEQNARYLTGMPPDQAVAIIAALDDQEAIDVFRVTEAIAQQEGAVSLVSVWLSRLPPQRAAALQTKMNNRPASLY